MDILTGRCFHSAALWNCVDAAERSAYWGYRASLPKTGIPKTI